MIDALWFLILLAAFLWFVRKLYRFSERSLHHGE